MTTNAKNHVSIKSVRNANLILFFLFGVNNVPTIRSHYSFEQFEAVLQKLAHEMALDALKMLKGELRIIAHSSRLNEVQANNIEIRFYASHLSFSKHTRKTEDGIAFEIENKEYSTSNHRSKISYFVSEAYEKGLYDPDPKIRAATEAAVEQKSKEKAKQKEKQITEFLDKLMQGIKHEPRFKLAAHARTA